MCVLVLQDILVDGRKVAVVDVQEQKPGAPVADIRVVDEDVNDTHALFLSGSASSQFTVSGGQLWVGGDLGGGLCPCSWTADNCG